MAIEWHRFTVYLPGCCQNQLDKICGLDVFVIVCKHRSLRSCFTRIPLILSNFTPEERRDEQDLQGELGQRCWVNIAQRVLAFKALASLES